MVFSQAYWVIMVVAGLLVAAAIAMAAWAFNRYNNFRILSQKPSKTTARLTKKSGRKQWPIMAELTQTPVTYWVEYEFKDSRGKAYLGKSKVAKDLFDAIQPNVAIDVVYDHDNPERNSIETVLEQEKFKHLMLFLIGLVVVMLVPFLALV